MNRRIENLRLKLAARKLDAFVVSQPTNRRYLSGFTGSDGFLFITRHQAVLATDFRYIEQAALQAPDFEIKRIAGSFAAWLPELVETLRARRIGFESDDLTLTAYRQIAKSIRKLPPKNQPSLFSTQGLVESLRAVKDAEEIKLIEKAAALADAAEEYAAASLEPGMTERQLAWELEKFLRERESEGLPFDIIVASGPNAALPHAQPSKRVINSGEPVVVDLGARLDGYTSDMTRTICLGQPEETFRHIYIIVQRAQEAALKEVRPGMTGGDIDGLAREVIEQAGYGDAFGHSLGHGVGIDTHEQPRLGPNSADILREGMVFTIEPGIYLPEWGGVRIEDMVSLEKKGARTLTKAGKLNFREGK
ncbi:MAG: aminopeptidase P family protein [Dehalococcoidia bacterium]